MNNLLAVIRFIIIIVAMPPLLLLLAASGVFVFTFLLCLYVSLGLLVFFGG